jgi:hypothetical protein
MANKIKIAPYDGVILEVSNFYSKPDCEEIRKKKEIMESDMQSL